MKFPEPSRAPSRPPARAPKRPDPTAVVNRAIGALGAAARTGYQQAGQGLASIYTPPPGTPYAEDVPGLAHTQALHDVAAALGGIPSVDTISQPYQAQGQRTDQLTQQLVDQLKGEQTYRVNLATGLPEAQAAGDAALQQEANARAAAIGGQAGTLPGTAAAGTLASFGTSAANMVAQQQAAAPLAGLAAHSQINQALQNALNQRTQAVTAENAKLPALEDQYRTSLNNSAFQGYVADRNYKLAAGNANFDQQYKTTALGQSAADKAAAIKAANARAAAGRQNQWKIAQARITADATKRAASQDAATAKASKADAAKRSASLSSEQRYVDSQLQSRYKTSAGKAGATTGYDVAYTYVDRSTDTEKAGSKHLTPQQYDAYKASKSPSTIGLPTNATITGTTPRTTGGTPGKGATNPDRAVDWAKGYLQRQNTARGWGLTAAEVTRLAQQSVRDSGIWPEYGRRPAASTRTRNPGTN